MNDTTNSQTMNEALRMNEWQMCSIYDDFYHNDKYIAYHVINGTHDSDMKVFSCSCLG